jgi:hypothetical protein
MKYDVNSVDEYMDVLPEERRVWVNQLRDIIKSNLPQGFVEDFQYDMIAYVIPLSRYPKGYHVKENTPLAILYLASQKNSINVYHSGIYMDKENYEWFVERHKELLGKKPDMGKSCIRFKKVDDMVIQLIGELATKYNVDDYIELYENARMR